MDEDPQLITLLIQGLASTSLDFNLLIAALVMLFLSVLFSYDFWIRSGLLFFRCFKMGRGKSNPKIAQIKKLLHNPNRLLATILISNNFINVVIIILSTYLTSKLLDFNHNPIISFIIQVVVVTFALLLLGEVIPKVYANQKSLSFAKRMCGPLLLLSTIFKPLSSLH